MKIKVDVSALSRTKWQQYLTRFVLGGGITVVAGLIAKKFGPAIGGLFLAFPAIFPASATLVEKHERTKKVRAGVAPGHRGRDAAALDAQGAAMGSLSLIAFAVLVWQLLPNHATWFTLLASMLSWLVLSVIAWMICERV